MADLRLPREFEWRGRTVAWEVLGAGPPVVMCHGTPWSAQLWAPFARALSREFRVYLWDMPGYGQSSKRPEHPVDLGVQGEVLAALLAHWELAAPHVVAHDYGGAVSLRAHLLHGARYGSLALVDVVALRPWGSDFFRLVGAHPEVFAAQPRAVHRGALEAYVAGASHRGLTAAQRDTLTAPWLTGEGQAAFYRQIAQADERFTAEIEPSYPALALPVAVVWGREDTWIPVDRAERLATTIPGAELEIIDGAGHLVQYDAPVELAVALHRWLYRQAARDGRERPPRTRTR
jgi:pimeloyl-ACP methyl ester carboxylesterase